MPRLGPRESWRRTAGVAIHEAAVVPHDQVGFDAVDEIEHDGDDDQQAGAAEELCDLIIARVAAEKEGGDERGDDGDDAEERGADVGDAEHHVFEIIGGALAGAEAGDERAVVAQLVGHFLGLELDGVPEVAEEEDHGAEEDVSR